jgi:hypothetical protein
MKTLPSLMVLALVMAGCATSHQPGEVSEVYVPATPTSNRVEPRVYPETGETVSTPVVSTPSQNVSPGDLAIAESVSQLFVTDSSIEPWASRVIARVEDGVVTLRGTVPSTHDKEDIESHISRLPGVKQVDNRLEVSMR